ncbi:MAG: hypothetical protein GY941_22460 [Planctomycetes bacterium]|nr:hypothetical protein [Planctomycetota bacterium]
MCDYFKRYGPCQYSIDSKHCSDNICQEVDEYEQICATCYNGGTKTCDECDSHSEFKEAEMLRDWLIETI